MIEPYYADDEVSSESSEKACGNCGNASKRLRRGWCFACYQRWLKAGRPGDGPPPLKNNTLDQWRQAPSLEFDHEPTDLDVGAAGEHLVCADLLLSGFKAFRTDQTCAYDVAVDLGGRLIRLQVKSTCAYRKVSQRQVPQDAYQWHIRRMGLKGRRVYAPNAFDLLGLVALDIRAVAYVPPSMNRQTFQIRPPGSNAGKQFNDFPFDRALHEIGGDE